MPDENGNLTEDDLKLLKLYARKIVARRIEPAVIFFLESMKPLNFIASQFMMGFQPLAGALFNPADYQRISEILAERKSVDIFLDILEDFSARREKGEDV